MSRSELEEVSRLELAEAEAKISSAGSGVSGRGRRGLPKATTTRTLIMLKLHAKIAAAEEEASNALCAVLASCK